MSRKIVVCLDGTGNEIEKNESNVLRLYKCLNRSENQLVYYNPGVGTLDTRPFSRVFLSKPKQILGLINGLGLETNVLRAYQFLCENYGVFRAWRKINNDDPRLKHAKLRMLEKAFQMRHPSIRFLGLWDTVSSLIRLGFGKGTFIQFGTHSSVDENPSVESVRHVLAIDETRRFFRHQFWTEGQTYFGNRFKTKNDEVDARRARCVKCRWA